jgi:hypothetical protein
MLYSTQCECGRSATIMISTCMTYACMRGTPELREFEEWFHAVHVLTLVL